jgi:hypothetical protein
MTEQQHPLTNMKALSLFSFDQLREGGDPLTVEGAMRIAANWQLEQVLNLLDEKIAESPNPALPFIKEKIKQAMRPQEENS